MLRRDPFITGQYYHIYNRGIDKRVIFNLKHDYYRFIDLLYLANSQEPVRFNNVFIKNHKKFYSIFDLNENIDKLVSIGAWCLMPNHFHLLIRQEIDGGITKFMKKLSTGYAMYFNKKYERQGALFGGLFKSKLINEDDNYLRQLFAYIHLNPLDLNFSGWENNKNLFNENEIEKFLKEYEYSSYLDYVESIDRKEKKIINKNNFPNYFQTENSFQDFIKNYFIKT